MIELLHKSLGWIFWPYSAALIANVVVTLVFVYRAQSFVPKEKRWLAIFGPLSWLDPDGLTEKEWHYWKRALFALGALVVLIFGGLLAVAK